MPKSRSLRLSTGFEVPLDGDLLAVIEALYREVTLGNALSASFETMRAEILSLIDQMSAGERRAYLAESLFLNSVTYENQMLSAYVRKLGGMPTAGKAVAAKARKPKSGPARKKSPQKR